VQKAIKNIFNKIEGPLENQPTNFPAPRCGGRESSTNYVPSKLDDVEDKSMLAYMVSLETLALAQNPQDAGPTAPPNRRSLTIYNFLRERSETGSDCAGFSELGFAQCKQ
jgi:hypothetical protein